MKALRNALRALRCRLGWTPGKTAVWVEADGQFWAAHHCTACGRLHGAHPVAGLTVGRERVAFESKRLHLYKGWGL